MNLNAEQMNDIAKLNPGEGIIYFGGLRQAMKVKIPLYSIIEREKAKRDEARRFKD